MISSLALADIATVPVEEAGARPPTRWRPSLAEPPMAPAVW
jgi:hypothetical protein